jgi:prolyl 4-hydroxylase
MTISINFSNQVRDWIAGNLERGVSAYDVASELVAGKVDPQLAVAMTTAVHRALTVGAPMPDGSLTIDPSALEYLPMRSAVPDESRIELDGRTVFVAMRCTLPRIVVFSNFLSDDECTGVIAQAAPRLKPSLVVDPVTGKDVVAEHRSSDGMFFLAQETALMARIEKRIASLTGHPLECGEGMQVLHYTTGAESTPHFDFLMPSNQSNVDSLARSGQRVATFICYLNDVEQGGATRFPTIGLSVTPRRGDAIYFEYSNGIGQCDPASLHAGAPVIAGEKWVATKWIRERKFVSRS